MFQYKPLVTPTVVVSEDHVLSGHTEYDEVTGAPTIEVPPDDVFGADVVRYHEMLHATYDGPGGGLDVRPLIDKLGVAQLAGNVIEDARVQLVYWQKGANPLVDQHAVAVALGDLENIAGAPREYQQSADALWDSLRALATLTHLGNHLQYGEGLGFLIGMYGQKNVKWMRSLLKLIKAGRIEEALISADSRMTTVHDEE